MPSVPTVSFSKSLMQPSLVTTDSETKTESTPSTLSVSISHIGLSVETRPVYTFPLRFVLSFALFLYTHYLTPLQSAHMIQLIWHTRYTVYTIHTEPSILFTHTALYCLSPSLRVPLFHVLKAYIDWSQGELLWLPESKNKSNKHAFSFPFCIQRWIGFIGMPCYQFTILSLSNFLEYLLPLTYSPSSSKTRNIHTTSKIWRNKKTPQQFIKSEQK